MTAAKAKPEKTDVTKLEPAASEEGARVLTMIDKVLAVPDFPVEKLERLFDLYQKQQADMAKRAYLSALATMQPLLPVIEKKGTIKGNENDAQGNKTGNKTKQSQYARWEDVVEGVRPILAAHGFSISFKTEQPTPDRIAVTATLGHRDGHTESTTMSLPIDSSGSKNNVQGWGSSVSYGKRYTAFALLNIVARGEDDDGEKAGQEFVTDEQANALLLLIKETNSDPKQFLDIAGVENVSDILTSKYEMAHNLLMAKKRKMGAPV